MTRSDDRRRVSGWPGRCSSTAPARRPSLAERLELTPAAVRRHLDQLLAEGVVEAREPRVYGARGRGRPAEGLRDHRGGPGRASTSSTTTWLSQALRFLDETGGDAAVLEFARRRVAGIETHYDAIVAADPGISPAEALARALTQGGYAAIGPRRDRSGEQLCQQHCPVSHVAHEFPQLCEAETEAICQVLGRHVQRLATIAHGDGVCTTCIPDPAHDFVRAHERLAP